MTEYTYYFQAIPANRFKHTNNLYIWKKIVLLKVQEYNQIEKKLKNTSKHMIIKIKYSKSTEGSKSNFKKKVLSKTGLSQQTVPNNQPSFLHKGTRKTN